MDAVSSKLILVTGGTGYIGSHTVVELQQRGYKVLIADNLSNSHIEVLGNIEKITGVHPQFVKAELADKNVVRKLFTEYPIAAVIHFAG